jgi:hypothetical protein
MTSQADVWAVRVPVGPLPPSYITHSLTTATPLEFALPDLTPSTATFLPSPAPRHFRSPAALAANTGFASKRSPIISLHVSIFTDGTCIGISFPHGLVDARGMGEVVHALDAEVHGRAWTAPEVEEENVLVKALEEQKYVKSKEGDAELPPVMRDFVGRSWWTILRMLVSFAYEFLWHNAEASSIFVGEEVVERIVGEVKRQVLDESGGKEWVTTGDVLIAWTLKVPRPRLPLHALQTAQDNGIPVSRRPILTSPAALAPFGQPLCSAFARSSPRSHLLPSPATPITPSHPSTSLSSPSLPSAPHPYPSSRSSTVAPSTPLEPCPLSTRLSPPLRLLPVHWFHGVQRDPIVGSLATRLSQVWRRSIGARRRRGFGSVPSHWRWIMRWRSTS